VIVDEMDLLSQLNDVEPLPPVAFERARGVLRETMASPGPELPVSRQDRRHPTFLTRGRAGLGLGAAAAAAAVAVALILTSAAPTSTPRLSAPRPVSAQPAANSKLATLAAVIKAKAGPLPGNASLVISAQTNGNHPPEVGYNLYTDRGAYYWAPTRSGLPEAIADHENLANGADAREVAAALYAVNGNLATARNRMINATPNPFGSARNTHQAPTAAQAKAGPHPVRIGSAPPPTGRALRLDRDNYLWNNCMDALTEGAGNPQVRIGVLRLLSTVPEVTVKNSTTAGQPTLTLTAGRSLFAGIVQQVLTISASTGIPVSTVSGIPGQKPSSVVTYHVSRVTLSHITPAHS
jgi:hypothetical protein